MVRQKSSGGLRSERWPGLLQGASASKLCNFAMDGPIQERSTPLQSQELPLLRESTETLVIS